MAALMERVFDALRDALAAAPAPTVTAIPLSRRKSAPPPKVGSGSSSARWTEPTTRPACPTNSNAGCVCVVVADVAKPVNARNISVAHATITGT